MWYDFFKVELPDEKGLKSSFRYVKSANVSEEEAVEICKSEKLKFQSSLVTLLERYRMKNTYDGEERKG